MVEFAFATLVTSDDYGKGALVVGAALRELHPSPPTPPEVAFQTVCIVTPETVGVSTIKELRNTFDVVVGVEVIDEHFADGLALLGASNELVCSLIASVPHTHPSVNILCALQVDPICTLC